MTLRQYPTVGIDFDNAGFPGNTGNPGVSEFAPPATPGDSSSGAEIDFAASAALEIGRKATETRASMRSRARLGWETSRPVTLQGSYQAPATAFTYSFLSFPVCTPNKIWEVMRFGVTAPDPFTTLAGVTVLAFRATFVPQDSNTEPPTFGDLLAVLGSVPNTNYPSTRSVLVRGFERVVLAFKGLANNQAIQASMDVVEHDLEAYLLSLKSV